MDVRVVTIGLKGTVYFKRRPQYNLVKDFSLGQAPTTKEAQARSCNSQRRCCRGRLRVCWLTAAARPSRPAP